MDHTCHYDSPLGGISLASDGEALIGLWFDDQAHFGETLGPEYDEAPLPVFDGARRWLDVYFEGRDPGFVPKLVLRGTPFQRSVWEALRSIPYGRTETYADLARRVGLSPASARAVGAAVGRNPVSLIVPCHRVLGANGRLTGYAGGLERKRWLLERENSGFAVQNQNLRVES